MRTQNKLPFYLLTMLVFLILIFSSTALASNKKVNLFTLVSIKAEKEICTKFTALLKEKFLQAEVFEILDSGNLSPVISEGEDLFIALKKIINKDSEQTNIENAVFGYISKKSLWYDVKVYLYTPEYEKLICSFSDRFYNEIEIERSAKNCAIEFASEVSSIMGTKIFFSSALLPGLGQMMMKNYKKSALFLGGFAYLIYKYTALGSKKTIDDSRFQCRNIFIFTGADMINVLNYYIDGEEVSKDTYDREFDKWNEEMEPLREYNRDIDYNRKKFKLVLTGLYLLNIVDTVIGLKEYDIKKRFEEKITFDVNPWSRQPSINFNYHF